MQKGDRGGGKKGSEIKTERELDGDVETDRTEEERSGRKKGKQKEEVERGRGGIDTKRQRQRRWKKGQ